MPLSALGVLTVAVMAVALTALITRYSRENAFFYASVLIISALMYVRSGDPLMFLVTYVSSITALLLYSRKFYVPFALLLFLSAVELYQGELYSLSLSISLGTAISILMSTFMITKIEENEHGKDQTKGVEIRRDVFQIGTGVVALLIMYTFRPYTGESIILVFMLLLYLLGNFSHNNRQNSVSRILYTMERENVNLGVGSIMLAVGVLFMFGLLRSHSIVLVGLFLVLIADPVATIAGKLLRGPKLPYNRSKTVSGFGIAFIASAAFSFFSGGSVFVLYALTGTLVESLTRKPLDDNITVPLSIVALNYVISLF